MFEWLDAEIAQIKSKRFHVVSGTADSDLQSAIQAFEPALPTSYKEFVKKYGQAKLYRELGAYLVGVYEIPEQRLSRTGETLAVFGHYDSSLACFKEPLLANGRETVFEENQGALRHVADGFEQWLLKRCGAARAQYGKRRWERIVDGPVPFAPREQAIVEARRRFKWRVVRIASDGDFVFEVTNESDMVLPYLSVGIRSKDGGFEGGLWLDVSDIKPRQTKLIKRDCYKYQVSPTEIEAFDKPDPEPEDRERYWELGQRPFATSSRRYLMNLTRRGLFGLIASLAGLFVAAKQRASATASTAKSKRPSHDYDYPRTYTYEYDPSQPLKSITGDGRVWHFTYDANARIIDCCR